jgi:hypothetical protein
MDGVSKPNTSDDYVFQIASISDLWVYKPGEMRDFNLKASGSLSGRGIIPSPFLSFFPICFIFNLYGDRL